MKKQSLEKCIDLLNRIGVLKYIPEPLDEFATQLISALDKITVEPKNEEANKTIKSAVEGYDSLVQLLDSIAILDKQRSTAFNALEEMKNLSGGDILPDEYDKDFINNNYGLFCAILEKDISEKLSFEVDEKIRTDFLNDIEKIRETFNNIVLDDFKVGKDKVNEIYVNKIISEDTLTDTGSKFLNDRLTEIISMHNRYCISKIQKQTINKLETFFDNDNCGLLDDKSEIFNIIKNVGSKLSVFKNCNSVKTNKVHNILNKNFYEIQDLFDNAARIFLETKNEEMVDKFAYFREVNPEEFVEIFKETKNELSPVTAWRYDTTLTPEDYKKRNAKCFITPFRSVVAIAADGEIMALCQNKNDKGIVRMDKIIQFAKEKGGLYLSCFSGISDIYKKYNFEERSREAWNTKIEEKAIANGWEPSFGEEDNVELVLKSNVKEREREREKERTHSKDNQSNKRTLDDVLKKAENEYERYKEINEYERNKKIKTKINNEETR